MTLADEFARNAEISGFVVHRGEPPEIEGAGVSRATYALADTGSVVLAASPEEPRAVSLLPDVHVTLVSEDVILAGLEELVAAVGDDLPSSLAIVTGPSRSASWLAHEQAQLLRTHDDHLVEAEAQLAEQAHRRIVVLARDGEDTPDAEHVARLPHHGTGGLERIAV